MVHIQLTNAQWLFPVEMGKRLQYVSKRIDIDKAFGDPSVQLMEEAELELRRDDVAEVEECLKTLRVCE